MDPFSPAHTETIRTSAGRLAYTDIGHGPSVVLLHGNPTNARLYRFLIRTLAPTYRCIAPDYLGFGRSEAPASFSYRPAAHATVIEAVLRRLDLEDLTLVLHDWGGPIGLSYALRHPRSVRRLVLANTWAWPLTHRPLIRLFSGVMGTGLGRALIERGNAFARLVMPFTLGRRPPRWPDWIQAYAEALDTPVRRRACWAFARSLIHETAWLRALWTHRSGLRDRPTLLCWGMADPAFGTDKTLQRWRSLFPSAQVQRWPNLGHYVPEEAKSAFATRVRTYLDSTEL
ncbi:MAG: haloalkane dehalogenase [Bacteroidetes bacterium QH_7_62_13]|nr:MAG: haloalkane dehalogenase [Bacteroidetes bacterium QH_7_62_13]